MQDRDVADSEWNRYLKKKYGSKYRVYRNEIGVWSIKCRYGFIAPFSIINQELKAVLTYQTQRGINILLKKLQQETALDFRIENHGDYELSLVFSEKDIEKMAELLLFGRKRQVSEEQRKILAARVKAGRRKWVEFENIKGESESNERRQIATK